MKPHVAGVAVAQEDVDAIVALVARLEHAQQSAQPDAYVQRRRPERVPQAQ